METTIETYRAAIDALVQYTTSEPDAAKRAAAETKIRDYRLKIIDAAFDDILKRTERLTILMQDLNAVIANASKGPSVSAALTGIQSIVTKIASSGLLEGRDPGSE